MTSKLELANTDITGDLWNSTGYWTQGGSDLYVTIGENAFVTGVISAGAYQHYAKTYEVGLYGYYSATGEESVPLEQNEWYNSPYSGSWENAKYISVVANTPYYYGANGVQVTVQDGGVWNVTDVSYLTGLTVDGGQVNGVSGLYRVTLDVAAGDNRTDDVTVLSCEPVEWNGGDLELTADDNRTFFLILPEGTELADVIDMGGSLGYGVKAFEGRYFGSFYDPETGLLSEPMPLLEQESGNTADAAEVTWSDYQAWLVSILPEISPFPDAVGEIILNTEKWEDIDMENGPWGKIFGEDAFNCTDWEEFYANGGVGIFNAEFVDLPAEDAPAGDASGEAS